MAALCGRDAARRDRAAQAWLAWGSHLGGGSAGPCVPGGAPPGADGGGDGAAAAAALRWSRTARAWAPAPGRAAGPGGAGAAAARAALRGAAARPPPPPPPATPDRPPPPWRTLPPPPAAAAVPARADWTVQPLLESYYCLRHATFDAPAAAVPPLSPSPSPPFPGVLLGAPTFRASAARVPLVAVHGARDWLCRAEGAARLAGAWGRGAAVLLLPASGHGAYDAATVDALVGAADELRGGAPGGGGGGGG